MRTSRDDVKSRFPLVGYACIWALFGAAVPAVLYASSPSTGDIGTAVPELDELSFEEALAGSLDADGDGIKNLIDNCPCNPNPDQLDGDEDAVGDECEAFLDVEIDIMPGDSPNILSLDSDGGILTAIISSPSFDATTVVPHSVFVSGSAVNLIGVGRSYLCNEEDVNGDGLADILCRIQTPEFLLTEGESTVVLEAQTDSCEKVRGEDSIAVVSGP